MHENFKDSFEDFHKKTLFKLNPMKNYQSIQMRTIPGYSDS